MGVNTGKNRMVKKYKTFNITQIHEINKINLLFY